MEGSGTIEVVGWGSASGRVFTSAGRHAAIRTLGVSSTASLKHGFNTQQPLPPQDGLCELNTFFLIARRQWKSQRTLFSAIYWATFFPMRIFLYPYMLVYFYRELTQPQYSRLSLVLCCGAQVVLILFNVVLLWLSVSNWWQRPARGGRRPAAPGAATATLSVGDGQSRAPKNAPTARKRISRAITSARDSMRVLR